MRLRPSLRKDISILLLMMISECIFSLFRSFLIGIRVLIVYCPQLSLGWPGIRCWLSIRGLVIVILCISLDQVLLVRFACVWDCSRSLNLEISRPLLRSPSHLRNQNKPSIQMRTRALIRPLSESLFSQSSSIGLLLLIQIAAAGNLCS